MSMTDTQNTHSDSATTFQERKARELSEERGIVTDTPPDVPELVELEIGTDDQSAHQPPVEYDDDLTAEDADLDTDEMDLPEDSEGDELSEDATHWKSQAEEAEHRNKEMQRDYTRKTQILAEQRRQLEADVETNNQVLAAYVNNTGQHLAKWDNVNWQQLQQTLDPATYQQRVSSWKQAVSLKDRALGQHQQFVDTARETLERQKVAEADLSRDILKATIPDWGNKLYSALSEFATSELDYAEGEFGDVTDHRVIRMIYREFTSRDPSRNVQQIRKKGSRPKGQRNQERGSNGRFTNAEKQHKENPGNRQATRDYFTMKLERERRDRNRR